jgi:hypothetical protein
MRLGHKKANRKILFETKAFDGGARRPDALWYVLAADGRVVLILVIVLVLLDASDRLRE